MAIMIISRQRDTSDYCCCDKTIGTGCYLCEFLCDYLLLKLSPLLVLNCYHLL